MVQLASSRVEHDLVAEHDLAGRADSNQVDHVQAAQVVFRQPDHDRAVPHSNVQAPRLNQLPAGNDPEAEVPAIDPANRVPANRLDLLPEENDLVAKARAIGPANRVLAAQLGLLPESNDLAAGARPISSLAVSSICPAIVMLVAKVPSLIADKNDLALRHPEGLAKAIRSPNDAIVCPTGVRNRSRTEQTG